MDVQQGLPPQSEQPRFETDRSYLNMLPYDEMMESLDPDPFYSDLNGDSLLQSNSSGQVGYGNRQFDRYTSRQQYYSNSPKVYKKPSVETSKLMSEENISISNSNETSETDQISTESSSDDEIEKKQKGGFWSAICCFDICSNQEVAREVNHGSSDSSSFEMKTILCGRPKGSYQPSRSSSMSQQSEDTELDEDDNSFEGTEINESKSFIECSDSDEVTNKPNEKTTTQNFNFSIDESDNGLSTDISMYIDSSPNAVNYQSPTLIFTLMQNKLWDLVYQRIKSHPKELSIWIYKKKLDRSMAWAMLPIHAACVFGCPAHIMKAMITTYPKGVTTGDSGWRLPVHMACHVCKSANVVRLLLDASPPTVNSADVFGHRCINLALESNGRAKSEVLRLLDNGVMNYSTSSPNFPKQRVYDEQLPPRFPSSPASNNSSKKVFLKRMRSFKRSLTPHHRRRAKENEYKS
jgi:hypothetical protein